MSKNETEYVDEKSMEKAKYKEELIASIKSENQSGFNKEINDEMCDFIETLDMKELKKFKKMVLRFDGNTIKAFRSYRAIVRTQMIMYVLVGALAIGLNLGWSWLTFIGLFAIPTWIFYGSMVITKGNKVLASILSVVFGIVGMYALSTMFLGALLSSY